MTTPKKSHHASHATEPMTTEVAVTNAAPAHAAAAHHVQPAPSTEATTATPAAPQVQPTVPLATAPPPATTSMGPAPAPSPGTATGTATFLEPPPPLANLPVPPKGFVPANVMEFRGVAPRSSELIAMPIAVADLLKFSNYGQVMGGLAPPLSQVLASFDITNQWSATRTASEAWDAYCRTNEGMAWSLIRPLMDRLKPAWSLAVTADPTIRTKYPGLTTLLGAKQAIAAKAVATKKANKQAVAAGEAATHGKVGKAATKKAQKAALAAQRTGEKAGGQATPAAPGAVMPVAAPAAAGPVVQAAAPVATAAPVAGTNGAKQ